ncbi:MAG: flagellin lysine-N-methylase [Clostridia bacterium]|nr:flagellin lysine-N-methylase [Clostridia bacterium]
MDCLQPDYYDSFSCKQGRCRASCCRGWPITVSLKDYYRLLSLDCGPALRAKLDCALHILDNPSEEEYAQLLPNFYGDCPMHRDDGRCALHAALGEDALPLVCRMYPRGVHGGSAPRRCCANSCEAVLELFLNRAEPIRFVGAREDARSEIIRLLQDRRYTLSRRILMLGNEQNARPEPSREDMVWGMRMARRLLGVADEHSGSLDAYGSLILQEMLPAERAVERYREAAAHFARTVPQWEIFFEHMLVNHVFFKGETDRLHVFAALTAIYVLLRLLGMSWMSGKTDLSALVDVYAAAFHLFDHTGFDQNAAGILRGMGVESGCAVLLSL